MTKLISTGAVAAAIGLVVFVLIVPLRSAGTQRFTYDASHLQTGDILFIRGTSWRSRIVLFLELNNHDFSHVGLIQIRDGVPYLIHATPRPSGEATQGAVIIERLDEFLSANEVTQVALYRLRSPSEGITEAATDFAESLALRATPFDHAFSLLTTEEVYCTELIFVAYERAGFDLLDGMAKQDVLLPSDLSNSQHLEEVASLLK